MSKDSKNEKNEFEFANIASVVTFAPYKISFSVPSKFHYQHRIRFHY